jgi:hypothetical protein
MEGDHHLQAAGLNAEQIESFNDAAHGSAADLFNNSHAVIGVNNFVADTEI